MREAISSLAPEMAKRVRVNPFGIVIPAPLDNEAQEQNTILFTGNFTHPPNVDAALMVGAGDYAPTYVIVHPGIHLLLIGIYPPPEVKTWHVMTSW